MSQWTLVDGALTNQNGERKSSYSGGQEGNCVVVSVTGA